MALQFAITDISFSNVEGSQRRSSTVSFNGTVKKAETAVHGFNFDFATPETKSDRVQVTTRRLRTAGNDVEVEAIVNYGTRESEYSATVNVLVIADV